MFNKLNFQVLIEILIEFFTSLILAINLYTGRINNFVHPKFNIILWFSVLVLIIMVAISAMSLFRPRHMNVLGKYFVIFIPIVLMFYINTDALGTLTNTNSSSQISSDIPAPTQNISPIKETVYKRAAGKA